MCLLHQIPSYSSPYTTKRDFCDSIRLVGCKPAPILFLCWMLPFLQQRSLVLFRSLTGPYFHLPSERVFSAVQSDLPRLQQCSHCALQDCPALLRRGWCNCPAFHLCYPFKRKKKLDNKSLSNSLNSTVRCPERCMGILHFDCKMLNNAKLTTACGN